MKIRRTAAALAAGVALAGGASLALAPSASAHVTGASEVCVPKVLAGSSATNYFCVGWYQGYESGSTNLIVESGVCKVGNHSNQTIYVTKTVTGKQSASGTNTVGYTNDQNVTIGPGDTGTWACDPHDTYYRDNVHTNSDGKAFANVHWAIAGQSYVVTTNYSTVPAH